MILRSLLMLLLLVTVLPAQAERALRVDGYVIHYNAMTTDLLTPEVAQRHAIVRSRQRALINIAVLRENAYELDEPLTATVSGGASNLAGQSRNINMREVRESTAIYYLGEVRVEHEDPLSFEFQVRPEGATRDYTVRFRQAFHTR